MNITAGLSDLAAHPMQQEFQPPPGRSYTDKAFGTRITRITGARPADGDKAVIRTLYSTVQAWNADESLLMLWDRARGHVIYEGKEPYRLLGQLNPFYPTTIEGIFWDPIDPYKLWYPSALNRKPLIICHDLHKGVSVHIDLTKPPYNLPLGRLFPGDDPQWVGRGSRRLMGLLFEPAEPQETGDPNEPKNLWLMVSLTECVVTHSIKIPDIYKNALMPTPSEKYVQLGQWVVNADLEPHLTLSMSGPYEHACPGLLMEGVDTWNTVDFNHPFLRGSLVSHRVDTGEATVIVGPSTGYPYPPAGTHISAVGPPEWAAVSIVGQHHGQTLLDNELLIANTFTKEVRRIAHVRAFSGTTTGSRWGYWAEPQPVISPTGTRIIFNSDWLNGPTVDTYVADLR